MRQVDWREAEAGDVMRVNGRELTISQSLNEQWRVYVLMPDGITNVPCHIDLMMAIGATLHRSTPPLPQGIGAVVRVEGTTYVRCFDGDDCIKQWVTMREGTWTGWLSSAELRELDFEVLSEGVEVPE